MDGGKSQPPAQIVCKGRPANDLKVGALAGQNTLNRLRRRPILQNLVPEKDVHTVVTELRQTRIPMQGNLIARFDICPRGRDAKVKSISTYRRQQAKYLARV